MSLLPVIAVAALVVVTGCSSASTKHATAGGTAAATTAGGRGSVSTASMTGVVHLTDYTDNDGPSSTVILAGAIGDFGTARRSVTGGSTNGKNAQLDLVLAHGSFRLNITDLDKKFLADLSTLPVNAATCSSTTSVAATVPIVAGSGAGSYRGISGSFALTITLDEIYRPPACSETSAYLAQSIVTTGTGSISLG